MRSNFTYILWSILRLIIWLWLFYGLPLLSYAQGAFDGMAFDRFGQIYLSTKTDLFLFSSDWSTVNHQGSIVLNPGQAMYDLASVNFPKVVLPTSWKNFVTSMQEQGGVALGWQYGHRVNVGVYSVQQSADCQTWTEIGAKQVMNADSFAVYTFTDAHRPGGKVYYRIRLQCPNESDSYSGIRIVHARTSAALAISLNPVLNTMNIQCSEVDPVGGSWFTISKVEQ